LKRCYVSGSACEDLAAALVANKSLVRMDLSGNRLGLRGLKLLCEGLQLKICQLTAAACEDLASTLSVNQSLRELDLSLNDLGDPGVQLLCVGLSHPTCKLQTLRLDSCSLTAKACEPLSCILEVNQTLTELHLTNNALRDPGVRLLCKRLGHPGCKLRVLW
ncbi:NACHT, LRR and PYD domains-containing protein 12-like, partial [Orycteropus afer afer]|uniref:NACHT, LRR and PYD domains-containing protein 12-like n=1 Tax=Orycteropus afer afer TaxID=1230840 RepID=A0A8B7BE67_ORYAF